STFGRPGHQPGDFTHGHTIATDSAGNLYVAETTSGRRVQRAVTLQGPQAGSFDGTWKPGDYVEMK
ncbi:MAG: hypothetical protein O6765_03715, partial [Gammaproteobacteria bacterium]|nr:hypothetical protein [Gammaproteobacteria bacterium]